MAKSGYKRFKKQEKAKVKLKGNKALLPKGQNVTDTNFKVKKIVVKEQLKKHGEHELLTKKHLNIKELISRLTHHNVGMCQEAISGLRELVSAPGSDLVLQNLSPLLQAVMTLSVNREADLRKDSLKLLSDIFHKVTEDELGPLFPSVVCHLTCAMTHIEPAVRADSLHVLDAMLAALPTLTARHTHTLLPHFLDLISHQGDKARSLSLNLDSRVTSDKWRARVIGRLNKLFSVILDHTKKDQTDTTAILKWNPDHPQNLNLYRPIEVVDTKVGDFSNLPIQEYAKTLMPLLLDAFVEAVPKQGQEDTQSGCVVGEDVAILLQSIVDIILHIWKLFKSSLQSESLTKWFRGEWGEAVGVRLLRGRFPYTVTAGGSRKRKREASQLITALQPSRDQDLCISLLNLQLCLLSFLVTPPGDLWTSCVHYIKRRLRGDSSLRLEESAVLCECLEAASGHKSTDTPSLLTVVYKSQLFTSVDKPVSRRSFDFLTEVALDPSHPLHQDSSFTTWLDSLPSLLCRDSVPLSVVNSIAKIATRNLPVFSNSLDGWIEEILENLAKVQVGGAQGDEGCKHIINLVYWVRDWDQELVDTVGRIIREQGLAAPLTGHLLDVLKFKALAVERQQDTKIKSMLSEILSQNTV